MEVLGLSAAQIRSAGAQWTAREIAQQPQLWPQIARQVAADGALRTYLAPLLGNPALRIVLTGAGTSAYIGKCLAPALSKSGRQAEAIPTTDIVASPQGTLGSKAATLMVHFARSGDSPESVAALQLAEGRIEHCHHLIVTCNAGGELCRRARALRHAYAIVLPEACNDRSFAMTSSFTGMLLAAALALGAVRADPGRIEAIAALGTQILTARVPLADTLVRAQFDRVVFVGSNELKGLALESALKMLELTDGRVVSIGESPLGFRHGPKTIVNGSTLVVAFMSNDAYTSRYDLDLLRELRSDAVAGRVVALTARRDGRDGPDTVVLDGGAGTAGALTDLELCLPYVAFAQTLALLRSISLGLSPDTPNAAGTVNRVVQGVSIHPFPASS
ncbi:MAG: SIS domain-containing protein [Gammaproteobacteria bacterium]|nr:SIS domain-containing protein [Gammaproteobacteria bacterium]MDE2263783.1 SIS domain-containing protein [Gammaproteobacteria bacterium]